MRRSQRGAGLGSSQVSLPEDRGRQTAGQPEGSGHFQRPRASAGHRGPGFQAWGSSANAGQAPPSPRPATAMFLTQVPFLPQPQQALVQLNADTGLTSV